MIIAVESALEEIKKELQQRGYQVIDLGRNQQADAIVYYKDGNYLNGTRGEMQQSFSLNQGDIPKEAFLVNAYNKSVDEIDAMIQRRSYSPLFGNLQ